MKFGDACMMKVSKRTGKIIVTSIVTFLMACLFVFTGVAVVVSVKKKSQGKGSITPTNPIVWSVDDYDGEQPNTLNWLSGDSFANRGSKAYTINSAESFLKFIEIVNSDSATEYNYFKDYTIYLNKSINMNGYHISSIGKKITEDGKTFSSFQGVFDGSYYTIQNAVIDGNGLFGYTENATIKNIGLYNCTIDSAEQYVGGILGEGVNTTIENTFVRLGSIKSNKTLGGIAGKITIDRTINGAVPQDIIRNSFVDSTLTSNSLAGIVGEIVSKDNAMENGGVVSNCYFSTGKRAYYTNNMRIRYTNVLALEQSKEFSSFNVRAYSPSLLRETNAWTNYTYIEGSKALNFNYPLLAEFVKVFMTGSSYENVTVKNGEVKNATTLYDAFKSVEANEQAEVNIIVEKVFMNETAVAGEETTIKLNSTVDTMILRGEKSPQTLFVSTDASTLVLGDTNATSSTPALVLDGDRDRVEKQGLKSGVMVMAEGKDFKMGKNVVIQNNVNNVSPYGGGLLVIATEQGNPTGDTELVIDGGVIQNCKANNGGGLVVLNTNSVINNMTISNNEGGGISFENLTSKEEYEALRGLMGFEKISKSKPSLMDYSDNKQFTSNYGFTSQKITSSKISGNSRSGESYTGGVLGIGQNQRPNCGGGVRAVTSKGNSTLTIEGTEISSNYCSNLGGGVFFGDNDADQDGGNKLSLKGATIKNNEAGSHGGGIYVIGTIETPASSAKTTINSNVCSDLTSDGLNVYRANSNQSKNYGNGKTLFTVKPYLPGGGGSQFVSFYDANYPNMDSAVATLRYTTKEQYGSYKTTDKQINIYPSTAYGGSTDVANGAYTVDNGWKSCGWSVWSDISDVEGLTSNSLNDITYPATYYMIYKRTITYKYGYQGSQSVTGDQYCSYDIRNPKGVTVPTISASSDLPGWTYKGMALDTSSTVYGAGTSAEFSARDSATYYAVYEKDFTINYLNGASDASQVSGTTSSDTITAGYFSKGTTCLFKVDGKYVDKKALKAKIYERNGYNFSSWKTATGKTINGGSSALLDELNITPKQTASSISVTAQWTMASSVTFDSKWKNGSKIAGIAISAITSIKFANCPEITNVDSTSLGLSNYVTENGTNYYYVTIDGTKYYYTGIKQSNIPVFTTGTSSRTTDIAFAWPNVIYSPASSASLFAELSNCVSISFDNFDTSNVTSMSSMFYNCSKLTSLDLSGFNTGKVIYMNGMFSSCNSLKSLDLSGFDTSKVGTDTNHAGSMIRMFYGCSSLTDLNLSNFNTSKVTNMSEMFSGCMNLKSPDLAQKLGLLGLDGFDTSSVTSMTEMFTHCYKLTELDLSNFKTSKVTSMTRMFYVPYYGGSTSNSSLKSLNLSSFDLTACTSLTGMLNGCLKLEDFKTPYNSGSSDRSVALPSRLFDIDDGHYNKLYQKDATFSIGSASHVLNVKPLEVLFPTIWRKTLSEETTTGTSGMIYGGIGVGSTDITSMLFVNKPVDATSFEYNGLTYYNKNVRLVENGIAIFAASNNTDIAFVWENDILAPSGCKNLFSNLNVMSIIFEIFNTKNATTMEYMFYGDTELTGLDLSGFDTSKVTDMYGTFFNCKKLQTLILINWDTSKVNDMACMFYSCLSLTDLDLRNFNTSEVTNMQSMFGMSTWFGDKSLLKSINLSSFNTGKVTNMSTMFNGCSSLESLDITNFNTSKVTNMTSMFNGCSNLESLDVSCLDTNKVQYMGSMFAGCSKLTNLDLSNFDISSATNMSTLFYVCYSLKNIIFPTNWNTNNVTYMSSMFAGCTSLESLDLSSFTISDSCDVENMLNFGANNKIKWIKTPKSVGKEIAITTNTEGNRLYDTSTATGTAVTSITTSDASKTFKRGAVLTLSSACDSAEDIDSVNGKSNSTFVWTLATANNTTTYSKVVLYDEKVGYLPMVYRTDGYVLDKWSNSDTGANVYLTTDSNVPNDITFVSVWKENILNISAYFDGVKNNSYTSIINVTVTNASNNASVSGSAPTYTTLPDGEYIIFSSIATTLKNTKMYCAVHIKVDLGYLYTYDIYTKEEGERYAHLDFSLSYYSVMEFKTTSDNAEVYPVDSYGNELTSYTEPVYLCKGYDAERATLTYGGTGANKDGYLYYAGTKIAKCVANTGYEIDQNLVRWYGDAGVTADGLIGYSTLDLNKKESTVDARRGFKAEIYTISYNLNGGTLATGANPTSYSSASTLPLTLNNPTKEKYTFLGWTGSNGSTPQRTVAIAQGTTDDLNYTANWQLADVTFDWNWKSQISGTTNGIGKSAQAITSIRFERTAPSGYTYSGKALASGIEIWTTGTASAPSTDIAFVWSSKIYAPSSCKELFGGYYIENNKVMPQMPLLTSLLFNNFDTSKVVTMESMFERSILLANLDLTGFDTSKVTSMRGMFDFCKSLEGLGLSSWNTENVTDMGFMFYNCDKIQNITIGSQWFTNKVTIMTSMFEGCSSLASIEFIGNWYTGNVTNMGKMFANCSSLTTLDFSKGFNTSSVTAMNSMFYNCSKLESIIFSSNWDTSKVETMGSMFQGCSSLKELDLSNWDTSSLKDYYSGEDTLTTGGSYYSEQWSVDWMFCGCSALETLTLPQNFITSKVTCIGNLFRDCSSLTSLDVSGWNTTNVAKASGIFSGCSSLTTLDLSDWNLKNLLDDYNLGYKELILRDCTSLCELRTPINSGSKTIKLSLPHDMFDVDNYNQTYRSFALLTTSHTLKATVNLTLTADANDGEITGGTGWTISTDKKTATKPVPNRTAYGTLPTATRIGYEFAGWFTEAIDGTQVTDTTVMGNTNTTIYAHWTINTSTIKLGPSENIREVKWALSADAEESEWTKLTTSGFEANANTNYYFMATVDTLTGYTTTFLSWSGWFEETSNPSTGHSFTEKGQTYIVYASATREANWYTITANTENGSITQTGNEWTIPTGGKTATKQVTYNTAIGVLPTVSSYESNGCEYTFDRWVLESDSTVVITATTTMTYKSDITIIPKFKEKGIEYSITVKGKGGSYNGSESYTTNYTRSSNAGQITIPTFTRANYTFEGWEITQPDTCKARFVENERTLEIPAYSYGDITLTAKWKLNVFTLTANANGGSISTTNGWTGTGATATKQVANGIAYGTLPEVTPLTGYTLAGWYTEETNGTQVDENTTMGTADTTIYAHWTLNTSTIKLGTLTNVSKVEYSTSRTGSWTQLTTSGFTANANTNYYFKATVETATGYTIRFSGWSGWFEDTSNPSAGHSFIENNKEYTVNATATKVANMYTLTADANGGTITYAPNGWTISTDKKTATRQVAYDDTYYGTLPTVKNGVYVLHKWMVNGSYVTSTTKMADKDTTIKAVWNAKIYFEESDGVEKVMRKYLNETIELPTSKAEAIDVPLYGNYHFTAELKAGYEFVYFESDGKCFVHESNETDDNGNKNTDKGKCYKISACRYMPSAETGGKTYYIKVVTKFVATEIETPTGAVTTEKVYGYDEFVVTTVTAKNGGGEWIYSLTGTDADKFTLSTTSATTGSVQVSFKQGANVGSYTCQVKATSTSNGTSATTGDITVTITQREVTITWLTQTTFTYDGNEHSVKATIGNLVNSDSVTFSYTGTTTAMKAGNYTATISGLTGAKAGNYKLPSTGLTCSWKITKANGFVQVEKAEINNVNFPNEVTNKVTNCHDFTALSITSGDQTIVPDGNISIDSSTHVITINPIKRGSVTITVTCAETENYNKAEVTFTISWNEGKINYTVTGFDGEYDGKAHGIQITDIVPDTTTVKFGTDKNNCTLTESPTLTNVGTLRVYFQLKQDGYTTVTDWKDVVIKAKNISTATTENVDDQTYTGSQIKPTPEVSIKLGQNTIATTLSNGTDFDYSYRDNTVVGTATITITGKGNYTGTITKTFNIVAQEITVVPTEAGGHVYNGSEQKTTWNNFDQTKLETTGPLFGTIAGDRPVNFKPKANYKWSQAICNKYNLSSATDAVKVTWTIAKAKLTISAVGNFATNATNKEYITKIYDGTTTATVTYGTHYSVTATNSDLTPVLGEDKDFIVNATYASEVVGTSIITVTLNSSSTNVEIVSGANSCKLNGKITNKEITLTWADLSVEYNGKSQLPTATYTDVNGETKYATITIDGEHKDVGTYTAKASVENYTITNSTDTFEITAKALTITSVTPSATVTKEYDGNRNVKQTFTAVVDGIVVGDDVVFTQKYAIYASKDVANEIKITVYFTLSGSKANNYTCGNIIVTTTGAITQRVLKISWPEDRTFEYNGSEHIVSAMTNKVGTEEVWLTYVYEPNATPSIIQGATNVGKYVSIVKGLTGADASNYKLPDTGLECEWEITKATVAVPTASTTTFTYNGSEQTYLPANWESIKAYVDIKGNTRTDAGSQTVTVSLKDTANYRWKNDNNNNDTEGKTLTFTIKQAQLTKLELNETSFIYNNELKTVTIKALWANETWDVTGSAQQGTDYTVSGIWSETKVGTWTATVEGKGNFTGTASAEWTIGKATSTVNKVEISGNNWVGQTLTANVTTDADGEINYVWRYRWTENDITKTTIVNYQVNYKQTLTLTEDFIGKSILVEVTIEEGASYNAVTEKFADITDDSNNTYEVCHGVVEVPTANTTTFTYTGSKQEYYPGNWDSISAFAVISNNTRTDAGTQDVTISLKENYCWPDGTNTPKTIKWIIAKATLTDITKVATVVEGRGNYDGNTTYCATITPKVEMQVVSGLDKTYGNTIAVTVGTATNLLPGRKDAGTQDVYFKLTNMENYNDYEGTTKVTVSATANPVIVSAIDGLVYTGETQDLVTVANKQGKVYFSFTSIEDAKSSQNETIPQGTKADDYIIYWYCTGDDNYSEASGYLIVTIAKANLTDITKVATIVEGRGNYDENTTYCATITPKVEMQVVSGLDKTYGNTIAVTVGTATNLLPGRKDAGTQDVYFKLTGMQNYNDYEGTTKVTVSATTNPVTVSAIEGLVYTGSAQDLVTVTGAQGEVYFAIGTELTKDNYNSVGNTAIPSETNAGDYTIYWYCTGDDNYSAASDNVTATIEKSDNNPTVIMQGYTYAGIKTEPSLTGNNSSGKVTYYYNTTDSTTDGYDWNRVTSSTYLDAGNYYMYAVIAGDTNYNDYTTSTTAFTILKANNTVVVTGKTELKYTGLSQDLVTVVSAQGEVYFAIGTELTKDNYNSVGNTAIPAETNANIDGYLVYWYCVGNNNYNAKSGNVNVTIDKADGILELSASSVSAEFPNQATNTITKSHDGIIEVESSNNEIATVRLTGSVITITPHQQKEVTISVTCNETENYNAKTITFTAKFTVGEISYSASGYTGVYDEKAHGITVTSSTPGAQISYSKTENGTYSSDEIKYKDVGEYTVWYKIEATGYTPITGSEMVKITPKDISGAKVTLDNVLTYNGSVQTQNVTVTLSGYTNVTYNITGNTGKDAGTYYLTIVGTGNFTGKKEGIKWTINKATLINSDFPYISADEHLVYNGNTQSPTWQNFDETKWQKAEGYQATDAGNYTAKFIPTSNYQLDGAECVEVEWSIAKAILTVTAKNEEVTYGDALPSYTYSITGFVNDGETVANLTKQPSATCNYTLYGDVNDGSYTITVSGGEAKNYTFTYINATLTVNKRVVTVEWQTEKTFTYDGKEHSVTATIGNRVNDDEVDFVYENNTATDEGAWTARITGLTGAKADNYALPTEGLTLDWSIGSAEIDCKPTGYEGVYDGKEHTGSVTVNIPSTGATIMYSLDKTTYDSSVCPSVKDVKYTNGEVDSYTVYFQITAFNYKKKTGKFTIKIKPRTLTVKPDALSKTYGDVDPKLTYTYSGNVEGETPDFEGVLTRVTGEDVGTYPISVGSLKLIDNGTFLANNYEFKFTEGVLFTINPQTTITSVEIVYTTEAPNTPFVYDGTEKSPAGVIVKVNGKELTKDVDYTISGTLSAIYANEDGYTIEVTGVNNYEGASYNDVKWFINKAEIVAPTKPNDKTYNSLEQAHGISVPEHTSTVEGNSTLKATNAGSYTVEFKLDDIGNYKWSDGTVGNKTVTWVINPYDLTNATIDNIGEQSFTGKPLTPAPTVIAHGTVLESGKQIVCEYANNTDVGIATVTIRPNNSNYTNSQTKEFNIVASSASFVVNNKTVFYNGEEHTIDPATNVKGGVVKYSLDQSNWSETLPTKVDAGVYTIYCKLETNAGYEISDAEKQATLTILRKLIAVPTAIEGLVYNGESQTGVNSGEGYTLTGDTAINAGSHTAIATLDKNHKWNDTDSLNNREISWIIEQFDLGYATIGEVPAQEFTGDPIEPKPTVTVKLIGDVETELTLGTDFVYSYENNKNAGIKTAKVTIKAVENAECNFKNSQSIMFTITKGIVEKPTAIEGLVYNGDIQKGVTFNENAGLTITGTTSETNAGKYSATFTLDNNHVWADGTGDPVTIKWEIKQLTVIVTWGEQIEWTYDGNPHAPTATAIGAKGVELNLTILGEQINASNEMYTASASLAEELDKQNYILENTTAKFKINPAKIDKFELEQVEFDYTGNEIKVKIKSVKAGKLDATYEKDVSKTSVWSATNADTYSATVIGTGNFTGSKDVAWKIKPKVIVFRLVLSHEGMTEDNKLTYIAKDYTINVAVYDGDKLLSDSEYDIQGNIASEVGEYKVNVIGKHNYAGSSATANWEIIKIQVDVPTYNSLSLSYNGKAQGPEIVHDSKAISIIREYQVIGGTGYTTTTEATEYADDYYYIVFKLNDTKHYEWKTTDDEAISVNGEFVIVKWSIVPTELTDAMVSLEYSSIRFDGNEKQPKVTVQIDGTVIPVGNYSVKYANNTNVGTATVTITGKNSLYGAVEKQFIISETGYNINYVCGEGVSPVENVGTYDVSADDQKINLNSPSRTGYVLDGWTISGDNAEAQILTETKGNQKVYKLFIPKNSYGHITLTAEWKAQVYAITYKLNDGTVEGQNPVSYTIETEDFTLINPTKSGYKFIGWTWTSEGNFGSTDKETIDVTVNKGSYGHIVFTANFMEVYEVVFTVSFPASVADRYVKFAEFGSELDASNPDAKPLNEFVYGISVEGANELTIDTRSTVNGITTITFNSVDVGKDSYVATTAYTSLSTGNKLELINFYYKTADTWASNSQPVKALNYGSTTGRKQISGSMGVKVEFFTAYLFEFASDSKVKLSDVTFDKNDAFMETLNEKYYIREGASWSFKFDKSNLKLDWEALVGVRYNVIDLKSKENLTGVINTGNDYFAYDESGVYTVTGLGQVLSLEEIIKTPLNLEILDNTSFGQISLISQDGVVKRGVEGTTIKVYDGSWTLSFLGNKKPETIEDVAKLFGKTTTTWQETVGSVDSGVIYNFTLVDNNGAFQLKIELDTIV